MAIDRLIAWLDEVVEAAERDLRSQQAELQLLAEDADEVAPR